MTTIDAWWWRFLEESISVTEVNSNFNLFIEPSKSLLKSSSWRLFMTITLECYQSPSIDHEVHPNFDDIKCEHCQPNDSLFESFGATPFNWIIVFSSSFQVNQIADMVFEIKNSKMLNRILIGVVIIISSSFIVNCDVNVITKLNRKYRLVKVITSF